MLTTILRPSYTTEPQPAPRARGETAAGEQRGTIPSFNRLSLDMAGPETQAQQPSGQAFSDDEQSQPSHLQPRDKALPWAGKVDVAGNLTAC